MFHRTHNRALNAYVSIKHPAFKTKFLPQSGGGVYFILSHHTLFRIPKIPLTNFLIPSFHLRPNSTDIIFDFDIPRPTLSGRYPKAKPDKQTDNHLGFSLIIFSISLSLSKSLPYRSLILTHSFYVAIKSRLLAFSFSSFWLCNFLSQL